MANQYHDGEEKAHLHNIDDTTTKRVMKRVLRDGTFRPTRIPICNQLSSSTTDVLYSCSAPEIDWNEYIDRIHQYAKGSNMCFILALLLILRTKVELNVFNAHRLLITSVAVAVKYLDDRWYSQSYYARVGGLNGGAAELNQCEIELLRLIDFNVHVSNEEMQRFIDVNEFLSKVRARL